MSERLLNFLVENWYAIAFLLWAAWNDFMALNPRWKSNSVVHFLKLLGDRFFLMKGEPK